MPETITRYTRLPGSGFSRKGGSIIMIARVACRLWLGDDHLLQVESTGGYSESYKRFHFRDIQAIYLRKTKSWLVANFVLGWFTGLFLLWALLSKNTGGVIALGIFTVTFAFFLLVNLVRGSTCVCHLKTAVHLEELPSLRRRRNAEKVLALIRPLIAAAQGAVAEETITQQYNLMLVNAKAVAATTTAAPYQVSRLIDPNTSAYDSRLHEVLYWTLLADAFASMLNIFLPCVPIVVLNAFTGLGITGLVLVALVKQHATDLKPALRIVTWITAAFCGIAYIISYIMLFAMNMTHRLDGTQWGYIKAIAALQPFKTPWWLAILTFNTVSSALLGVSGLLLLRQHWREKKLAA